MQHPAFTDWLHLSVVQTKYFSDVVKIIYKDDI